MKNSSKKLSTKMAWSIRLLALTEIILCLLLIRSLDIQKKDNTLHTYKLGIHNGYGYAGAEIRYDTEPVHVTLITPSGKRLNSSNADIYETDHVQKTITIMEDSEEQGLWQIEMDKRSNRAITYAFVEKPSKTLYIKDTCITEIQGIPYLKFIPVMSTENTKNCQYSITIQSPRHSFAIAGGKALLNKAAYIKITPPDAAMNGETYQMKLSVKTEDGINSGSDQEIITIMLPEKQETIETESSTETIDRKEDNNATE